MLTIPLVNGTIQRIQTTIGSNTYLLTTKYNKRTSQYSLDVTVDGVETLHGIQLVAGIDIFKTYPEMPLNRVYCVNTKSPFEDLSGTSLGTDDLVVIIEDSDLEA